MEKQLIAAAFATLVLGCIALGVGARLYDRRQKRLDAEAIDARGHSDTGRPLTFEEKWDEADGDLMRKYAHVTCRDYQREDKQAAHQLILGRKSYRKQFEKAIDQAWDRIARNTPRLVSKGPKFFRDFADMQSDLFLARGEDGYHGSMADTCWTENDSRELNKLLVKGAKEMKGKLKKKVSK